MLQVRKCIRHYSRALTYWQRQANILSSVVNSVIVHAHSQLQEISSPTCNNRLLLIDELSDFICQSLDLAEMIKNKTKRSLPEHGIAVNFVKTVNAYLAQELNSSYSLYISLKEEIDSADFLHDEVAICNYSSFLRDLKVGGALLPENPDVDQRCRRKFFWLRKSIESLQSQISIGNVATQKIQELIDRRNELATVLGYANHLEMLLKHFNFPMYTAGSLISEIKWKLLSCAESPKSEVYAVEFNRTQFFRQLCFVFESLYHISFEQVPIIKDFSPATEVFLARRILADGTIEKHAFGLVFVELKHGVSNPEHCRLFSLRSYKQHRQHNIYRFDDHPYLRDLSADVPILYVDYSFRKFNGAQAFHEFGHALHALLNRPPYQNISGIRSPFVEMREVASIYCEKLYNINLPENATIDTPLELGLLSSREDLQYGLLDAMLHAGKLRVTDLNRSELLNLSFTHLLACPGLYYLMYGKALDIIKSLKTPRHLVTLLERSSSCRPVLHTDASLH